MTCCASRRSSPPARLRLGWFVAQCQLRSSYDKLEQIPLETWLRRHCGREVTERIWKPLLASRFDGDPSGLPATYLWARTRRMSGARGKGGAEEMGHIVGGHQRLIDAMVANAEALDVKARTDAPVKGLATAADGSVTGVELEGETLDFDLTIPTLQPPALRFLLPERHQGLLAPYPERWLGCVCVIIKVKRSLLPYYATNIVEPTPITSAIETSQVLGTAHTDGLHLVYLPKYCDPSAPEQSEDDESVYRRFTDYLAKLSPGFSRDEVRRLDRAAGEAGRAGAPAAQRRRRAGGADLARRRRPRSRLQRPDLPLPAQRRFGDGLCRRGRGTGRRSARPDWDFCRECEKRPSRLVVWLATAGPRNGSPPLT